MINISRGGVFLKTAIPLSVGQRAKIIWRLEDESEIEAEAEVVWNCQGASAGQRGISALPGMGLKFIDVKRGKEKLESFFESMPAG